MNILHALVLGLVQGLGEFLPISSSAHLIITPWLFKWPDPGLAYDVALHWGTLLAVVVYFWNDIILLVKGFWHSLFTSTRDIKNNLYQKLSWLLIIASIPGAIIGKLLESKAEHAFRNPLIIAVNMIVFGLILWAADSYGKKVKDLGHIGKREALIVGLSQAVAVIPGVSRSGATMTAGMFMGFKREDVAKFSFLMSIPIIFGAGLLKLPEFGQGVSHAELLAGFLSAAVFGFLSIKYLLAYIRNGGFKIFVWYRMLFALLILIVYFARR